MQNQAKNQSNNQANNSLKLRKPVKREFAKAQLANKVFLSQPLAVRIFHWGFALALTGLILTGLELHRPFPFLAIRYSHVFIFHVVFAWLGMSFFLLRIVDMLIHKDTSLLPTLSDFKDFPKLLKYYLFFSKNPPLTGKYNSGQKLVFFSWLLLFAFICFISMASYWAGERLDWVVQILGGFQVLRWIKFMGLVYFSATILLHIYLTLTEDMSRLQAMVTGYEQKND